MQLPESPSPPPQDGWALLATCLVVLITGFISVARRVAQDQKFTMLGIVTEYSACLVVGYLAFEAYPTIKPQLPTWLSWVTQNIFTATGSYIGVRAFHVAEDLINQRLKPS